MNSLDKGFLKNGFKKELLKWNMTMNRREMPWKGEKDPYRIWLSEIILQQTRVDQGLGYYKRFIIRFPDIKKLASAKPTQVFKLWEGLGYYSRCSNLIETARFIVKENKARFPETYDELKKLKGIGPYTAAAISSFAFNQPHAVLDGNVFRVLARVFGIKKPIDTTEGRKFFTAFANELIDKKKPGIYNQAIMDFGALVCKPVPDCDGCIFQKQCFAFINQRAGQLPVKQKKQSVKHRWFHYLVLKHKDKIAIRQRNENDIWKHLFEFPMVESIKKVNSNAILKEAAKKDFLIPANSKISGETIFIKQQLSHQLIHASFTVVEIDKPADKSEWRWVHPKQLHKYSFPRVIRDFIPSAT